MVPKSDCQICVLRDPALRLNTLHLSRKWNNRGDCVKGNLSIVHWHSDKADEYNPQIRQGFNWNKSSVLNLRIPHEIHGFHSRNPQEIWGLHHKSEDLMDLMKNGDLSWINLRIYVKGKLLKSLEERDYNWPQQSQPYFTHTDSSQWQLRFSHCPLTQHTHDPRLNLII